MIFKTRKPRTLACIAALLVALAVITPYSAAQATSQGAAKTSEQESFRLVTITEGLSHPWSVAFLPGGDYLVSERSGQLVRVKPDGRKVRISGVPPVYDEGQGGLLDLALEPGFKDGGWLYFSYAAADERNRDKANTEVARAHLNLRENRLEDIQVIFKALPKVEGGNHFGSRLLFHDGYLYVTLGERFNYKEEAQNTANHLGTVVRLTLSGKVPADNPFVGQANARDEIFTYGHRNVQGIAVNPRTGDIWIHEHGPKGGDEINILEAGANYGWPEVTFGVSYSGFKISDKTSAPGMKDPVLHWTPSIAPSGMAFYTGDKFPNWQGDLFVGALAGQHLRRLEIRDNVVTGQEMLLADLGKRIRDVRQGPDGYIYILTDEPNGQLLRLEPRG